MKGGDKMAEKNKFMGNVVIKGKIKCETGMHIGGSTERFEVGGIDAPVIRSPDGYPYIPGSSVKGKMRYLMEWELGKIDENGDPHACNDENCPICRIFGTSAEKGKTGPTRLTVRDSHPTDDTKEKWENLDTDLLYTEHKIENVINRITSGAVPRDMERVPKDSEFDIEMVYGIYSLGDDGKTDMENVEQVFKAMRLLEDSALGGSGSRGYGKIKFIDKKIIIKSAEDYKEDKKGKEATEEKIKEEIGEYLGIR